MWDWGDLGHRQQDNSISILYFLINSGEITPLVSSFSSARFFKINNCFFCLVQKSAKRRNGSRALRSALNCRMSALCARFLRFWQLCCKTKYINCKFAIIKFVVPKDKAWHLQTYHSFIILEDLWITETMRNIHECFDNLIKFQ